MGEVAERSEDGEGQRLGFRWTLSFKETPQGPISLGCAEPALPEGEPRACGLTPFPEGEGLGDPIFTL